MTAEQVSIDNLVAQQVPFEPPPPFGWLEAERGGAAATPLDPGHSPLLNPL